MLLSRTSRRGPRAAALAVVAAGAALAAAAPAGATMVVYRDGNDVWAASPDGALRQRVTTDGTDGSYYSFPSADDAGTITAIKGASTTRAIWVLPRGAAQPTLNVMPWRLAGFANIGPTWARVNASGGSLAYTYLLNYGPWSSYPNGGFDDRYAIVTPSAPGSPTQPSIDQPAQRNPSWFGNRLVTSRNGEIFFETQPLQFTSWLADPNHRDLLAAEVNRTGTRVMVRRGDGRVVLAGWQGTVGSTAGTVTSQCLLPATGISWAALSASGTQVAWSDPAGLHVATVTAANATTCPIAGSVLLSAGGITPAFSEATLTAPDPGRRDPTDPTRRDPTDPTRRDPTDPTRRDPTDPTRRDPTDPTRRDPTDPTRRDPTDPTRRDPVDPDPGRRTPVDPDPGRRDPQTNVIPGGSVRLSGPTGAAARAAALRRGMKVTVTAPGAGALRLTATVRPPGARARTAAFGGVRATVARAGRTTVVVRPSRAAAGRLRRGARLTVTLTFTPKGGRAVVRRLVVTVR